MPAPDAPSSTTVDLHDVARLRVAVARMSRRLRQHADTGLTLSMQSALVTLEQHGPLSLGELADRERVAPATATKIVGRLVAEALAERTVDPVDRRVGRVAITAAGLDRLDESRRRRNAWLATQLQAPGAPGPDAVRAAAEVLEALGGFEEGRA